MLCSNKWSTKSTLLQAEKHRLRSRLDCEPSGLYRKLLSLNYFLGLAQSDVHSGSWALSCYFLLFGVWCLLLVACSVLLVACCLLLVASC